MTSHPCTICQRPHALKRGKRYICGICREEERQRKARLKHEWEVRARRAAMQAAFDRDPTARKPVYSVREM